MSAHGGTPVWLQGSEAPIELSPGHVIELPSDLRAAIAVDLDRLEPEQAAIAWSCLTHGESEGLAKLAESDAAARALDMWGRDWRRRRRCEWLAVGFEHEPLLLARAGALFTACAAGRDDHYVRTEGPPHWPYVLSYIDLGPVQGRPEHVGLGTSRFEAALKVTGESTDLLVRRWLSHNRSIFQEDFAESLSRHADVVLAALEAADSKGFLVLIDRLNRKGAADARFCPVLAEPATGTAKTLRAQARELLLRCPPSAVVAALQKSLESRSAKRRLLAVEIIAAAGGEEATACLRAQLEREKDASVRGTLEAAVGALAPAETSPQRDEQGRPELAPVFEDVPTAPLPDALRPVFETLLAELHAQWSRQGSGTKEPAAFPAALVERAWQCLADPQPWQTPPPSFIYDHLKFRGDVGACASSRAWLEHPAVGVVHHVRLHHLVRADSLLETLSPELYQHRRHIGRAYDVRTVVRALEHCGLPPDIIGRRFMMGYDWCGRLPFGWGRDALYPLFVEQPEHLARGLGLVPGEKTDADTQARALSIASWFDDVPPRLQPAIWALAFGDDRELRVAAQATMRGVPGLALEVAESLTAKDRKAKTAAANWLANLADPESRDALKAALRKEKHDEVRAACMRALLVLGEPPASLLDRAALQTQAERMLAKGIPEVVAELPLDTLPALRWLDSEPVSEDAVRLWVVQAVKAKEPAGNGLMEVYGRLLEPQSRRALANWAVDGWIQLDVGLPPEGPRREAAIAKAIENSYGGLTDRAVALEWIARNPVLNALKQKGVLSLAASMDADERVGAVRSYVHRFGGRRGSQCKALLSMLAHDPGRAALQLIVDLWTGFRTVGIQHHASGLLRELADRRGWSMRELADRSVGTAGVGPDGRATFTQRAKDGEEVTRRFVAKLEDDLSLSLWDEHGKALSAWPSPEPGEWALHAEAEEERLVRARKELKATLKLQKQRLYEVMCVERGWSAPEFREVFLDHPVMRRLTARLLWIAQVGDERLLLLPRNDGSLTGLDGSAVEIPEGAQLRLAHRSMMDATTAKAWQKRLKPVAPLFDQLRRPLYEADAELLEATEVDAFQGHVLKDTDLAKAMKQRGYQESPPLDKDSYNAYRRTYDRHVLVEIGFSGGKTTYEDDLDVALTSLRFSVAGERHQGGWVQLRDVPRTLLSECWNDLAETAKKGRGFDPDWRKLIR